jgi:DNA-binding FadR family transcriptional regulator
MSRGNADLIAAELRRQIESRAWPEGGRLPTERAIAEDLGVARNTVRRALDRLEQDGLLVRHVGRGTYLRSTASSDPIFESARRMEGASPADMMELRVLLEPAAAAFAATNATTRELAGIREAHERAVAADTMLEFEEWDAALHRLVLSCTRNVLLREIHAILGTLREQDTWYDLKQRSFSQERRRVYCDQHQEIVRSLERRLALDAEAAMRTHLRTVQENMIGR